MSRASLPAAIRAVPREYRVCKRGRRHCFPEDEIRKYRLTDDRGRLFVLIERCILCGTTKKGTFFEETGRPAVQSPEYKWPPGYSTTDLGRVESEVWLLALVADIPYQRGSVPDL